jgi:hypothetical protein
MRNQEKTGETRNQWSLGVFLLISFAYTCITIHVLRSSIQSFESSINSNLWDLKVSVINILVAIVFISISLSTKQQQLNMAFFWVFQFVFFGIGGLLSQIDPYPYYLTKTSSASFLVNASELIFVAQISVCFGQLLQMKRKNDLKPEPTEMLDSEVSTLMKRTRNLLKIYIVSLPIVIYQLGGFSFLLKRVRFGNLEQNLAISINAILQTLLYVPPVIAVMVLLYLEKTHLRYRFAKFALIIWILFLSNPLANARQTTLFLVLPLIFFFLQTRVRATILFFTALPLFFFYSAGVVNRYTGKLQGPRLSIVSRDGDFDSFSQIANGLQVITQGEFAIFRQVMASIFFFIPRSIYPGKPNDTGVELARFLGLKFQNLSAPWILESYVNARVIGVVLIGFSVGYFLSKIDLRSNLDIRYFLLGSLTTGFLFIVLRGSLLQATGRAVFSIAVLYLLLKGIKPKSS